MKKVVNIINGEIIVMQVEDNYIRCSVTGQFFPPSEFMEDGKMKRTNCVASYQMPIEEFARVQLSTVGLLKSPEFRIAQMAIDKEVEFAGNSISVEDLIIHLQSMPKNSRLVITQSGNYSPGELADIFYPEEYETVDNITYFRMGHSSQEA